MKSAIFHSIKLPFDAEVAEKSLSNKGYQRSVAFYLMRIAILPQFHPLHFHELFTSFLLAAWLAVSRYALLCYLPHRFYPFQFHELLLPSFSPPAIYIKDI